MNRNKDDQIKLLKRQLSEMTLLRDNWKEYALDIDKQLVTVNAEVERLKAEIDRVAVFLAIHGVSGYEMVDKVIEDA